MLWQGKSKLWFSKDSQRNLDLVLERADMDETRRMLILSKMNLEKRNEMFKDMCKELKLVLSGGPGTSTVEGKEKDKKADNDHAVKKEEEDAKNAFVVFNGSRWYKTVIEG